LKKIEKVIYKFIWHKKGSRSTVERIKRSRLKNEYKYGGLKSPDVQSINISLKTINILKTINKPESDIAILTDLIIHNAGNEERNSLFFKTKYCNEDYIKEGLNGINLIYETMMTDLRTLLNENTKINKRYAEIISSTNLMNYKTINELDQWNLDIMVAKGFYTFNHIYNCIIFPSSDTYIYRNNCLPQSLPSEWFKIMEKITANKDILLKPLDYIFVETNKFRSINQIKTSDIRKMLTKRICTNEDLNEFKIKFSLESVPTDAFIRARICSLSTKYRQTQFRVLHCDIFTKNKLCKIGITDNPLCDRCLKNSNTEIIEDLNHLFFGCPSSVQCWNQTETILSTITNETIKLDKNKILFGLKHEDNGHHKAINSI